MKILRMNVNLRTQLLFTLLLSILFASCQGNAIQIKLDGTRWTLQSLKGHTLLANTVITVHFDIDTIGGSAGCNLYGAKYALQPQNGITVAEADQTSMGCSEPKGVEEQESEYLNTFSYVTNYKVEDKILSLSNEQGKVLLQYQILPKFKGDPQYLVGKTWQLISAKGFEGVALSAFTLRFDDESKISGTTICREYAGEYGAIDDSLGIGSYSMTTDDYCSIEKDLIAEGTYTTLLSRVWQYNVSKTQLELYTIEGEKLVFQLMGQK